MDKEDVLYQLKSLKDNSEDYMKNDPEGEEGIFGKDIKALNIAIEAIDENDKLKQEIVYHMKRCVQAEMLLKEVEGFCPVLHRMEIRNFLES
jgi:3-hydroxyacyl-CoA dehydrogenase